MKKEENNLYKVRHTLAHILAKAVLEIDPNAKLAIGPPVSDGFYYDFELSDEVNIGELKDIQKRMRKIITRGFEPKMRKVSEKEAKNIFKDQPYKLGLIDEIAGESSAITIYDIAGFTDLCEGPHATSAKDIDPKAFKLSRVAGAYWRGDEKNKMLTRIYGLAFETKEQLNEHLQVIEEAKKRDHRKLGKQQDLFVFSELVGSGMPLYTPKGNIILNEIINYSRELNNKLGFGEVHTPNINKAALFKVSGHYEQYKEDMLRVTSQYVKDEMFLKPMNCPQHTQIYASQLRSYKDLPIRYSDFANLYRDERPGELSGLTRLRSFRQDDGHSFCREDQIKSEVSNILSAIQESLKTYKIDYVMRLSLRDPDKKDEYLGSDEVWNKSENVLRKLLQERNVKFAEEIGEAAFYGPKIDIVAVDALKREWQISTTQLDFSMPTRFGLEYTDQYGNKQTPVMIHRALIGSPERFFAILIEHYAGAFPTWLSPEQVRVIPIAETHTDYANLVVGLLSSAGLRAGIDDSSETLGKRIRNVKLAKVPYFLVIGNDEVKNESITVESRDKGRLDIQNISNFTELIQKEIKNKN